MKVVIITQARMTSTRLPGKVMLPADGKPILHYHLSRLSDSGLPIVVATTTQEPDRVITKWCDENGYIHFRGDEKNVLSRYFFAAEEHQADAVVRVTSDCPLVDGKLIKKAVSNYVDLGNPQVFYSNTMERTYPRGFDFSVFSFQLLRESFENVSNESDMEHVTPYIRQNRSGNVIYKNLENVDDNSDLRLTVDQEEDYVLIKTLIEKYGAHRMSHEEITALVRSKSELYSINEKVRQKE